jgi:hypothetical protein
VPPHGSAKASIPLPCLRLIGTELIQGYTVKRILGAVRWQEILVVANLFAKVGRTA